MKKDLHQLFEEFLFEAEYIKKVRPETLRGYLHSFTLLTKLKPNIALDTISSTTITEFFKVLQDRKRMVGRGSVRTGVKKSTVATYWSKLNTFFTWLHGKGYCKSNPFSGLSYPTPSYEEKKFLQKQDLEKIITAIHTHHDNKILILKRNLVIFYLFLFCGLRREELLSLQIRDIDFERKTITVRADTSKSGRSRQLPLHSTTIMYLRDYLTARKNYTTPFLIVSSKKDQRLTVDGLLHIVHRLQEHSGVAFHLHQFRHTFAVNFLNSSNNIAKLKQLLGHKSLSMTLTYLRCLPTNELRGDIESMSIDKMI